MLIIQNVEILVFNGLELEKHHFATMLSLSYTLKNDEVINIVQKMTGILVLKSGILFAAVYVRYIRKYKTSRYRSSHLSRNIRLSVINLFAQLCPSINIISASHDQFDQKVI